MSYHNNKELACNCKYSKIPSYRTNFDKNMIKNNKNFLSTVLTCPSTKCLENFVDYQSTGARKNLQTVETAFGRSSFDIAQNNKSCVQAFNSPTNFACSGLTGRYQPGHDWPGAGLEEFVPPGGCGVGMKEMCSGESGCWCTFVP